MKSKFILGFSTMVVNLIGKKALITGGSKGLGYAISHKLAQLGCSVTLLARNEKLLMKNIRALPIIAPKQEHNYLKCDLLDILNEDKTEKNINLHNEVVKSLTDVSILINCAGVTTHSLLPRISQSDIISTINLNLTAPIVLSKLSCRPMMKASNKTERIIGSFTKPIILNISSVLSMTSYSLPGTTVYAALKAGILGFTTSLAAELKGKIRVNALLPGLISGTEMGSAANVENDVFAEVTLEEVVNKAVEIISDDSMNGQGILVNNK